MAIIENPPVNIIRIQLCKFLNILRKLLLIRFLTNLPLIKLKTDIMAYFSAK